MPFISMILVPPRTGMTTIAVAMVKGFNLMNHSARLVVPTRNDAALTHKLIPAEYVWCAENVQDFTCQMPEILVFDDVGQCNEVWMAHGEGSLERCILARYKSVEVRATRIFMFHRLTSI